MTTLAIQPRGSDATEAERDKRARSRFRHALFWSGFAHGALIALLNSHVNVLHTRITRVEDKIDL